MWEILITFDSNKCKYRKIIVYNGDSKVTCTIMLRDVVCSESICPFKVDRVIERYRRKKNGTVG